VHHPSSVTVWTSEGEEVLPTTEYGNSYAPQIAEVERCLLAGLAEIPFVSLDDTVALLEVIDEARAQIGVHYLSD
jgi:hypothetical protein